jgi:protein phosphatase-4 regulatory subunit 3
MCVYVFLRFQDTLIVWAEAESCDLALSFQEKIGCDEIWEKICHVCVIVYVLRYALS